MQSAREIQEIVMAKAAAGSKYFIAALENKDPVSYLECGVFFCGSQDDIIRFAQDDNPSLHSG